jgi:thiol-disulfide isomerase/thioredoxin
MEKMVAAYKNASSYADHGVVRRLAETSKGKIDNSADFAVTLVRPNKFRAAVYDASVVCDGRQWHAFLQTLPNQVVSRDAPAKLSMSGVYADAMLANAMTLGFGGPPPQLLLLLGDDPLKAFLAEAEGTTLIEPGKIEEHDCYRVQIKRPDGLALFWIDKESYLLRRMEFPVNEFRRQLESEGHQVQSLSVAADFAGARFGGAIEAAAFQFELPPASEQVKFLMLPEPYQILGKKLPQFKFVDLAGKAVTADTLAGKVAVLDFWATWCEPCRASLPSLEKVFAKYKDNDKVMIRAVSVDEPDTPNATVEKAAADLKLSLPILRDTDRAAGERFRVSGIPAMILVGTDGIIQDCDTGENPNMATALPEKLDKMLIGTDLSKESLPKYQEKLKMYEKAVDDAFAGKLPEKAGEEVSLFRPKIAERTQPKTFKLTHLWKCAEVFAPGNLLVLSDAKPPRLLVLDNWQSVAEVGLDGKLIATHKFDMEEKEAVCSLRAAKGERRQRLVAGFATGHQRFHLFDENWKQLFSFPQDALKNPHSGIADVQLGDLDGDGAMKAYVSYFGAVGVQAVSLQAKRLWSNRSIEMVTRLAITEPDAKQHRQLLCTNSKGTLAILDAKGSPQGEIVAADCPLRWIVGADLTGDGRYAWCGLSARVLAEDVAIGLNLKGEVLWRYALPKGGQQQPIEPIVAGRITRDGPQQWILPGADGSIHFLAPDGKPLDQFNYGAVLSGLATDQWDGKPVLIVASANGLEAWRIEE